MTTLMAGKLTGMLVENDIPIISTAEEGGPLHCEEQGAEINKLPDLWMAPT